MRKFLTALVVLLMMNASVEAISYEDSTLSARRLGFNTAATNSTPQKISLT